MKGLPHPICPSSSPGFVRLTHKHSLIHLSNGDIPVKFRTCRNKRPGSRRAGQTRNPISQLVFHLPSTTHRLILTPPPPPRRQPGLFIDPNAPPPRKTTLATSQLGQANGGTVSEHHLEMARCGLPSPGRGGPLGACAVAGAAAAGCAPGGASCSVSCRLGLGGTSSSGRPPAGDDLPHTFVASAPHW